MLSVTALAAHFVARRSCLAAVAVVSALATPVAGSPLRAVGSRGHHRAPLPPSPGPALRGSFLQHHEAGVHGLNLVSVKESSRSSTGALRTRRDNPVGADFFNAFHEEESTFDWDEAAKSRSVLPPSVQGGWEPRAENTKGGIQHASWFAETPSGGPNDAWQTYSPNVPHGVADRSHKLGKWEATGGGHWEQMPVPGPRPPHHEGDARWYEESVVKYDDLGREALPVEGSAARLVADGFYERAVNTTLTCADPGCVANSTLQIFDPATEEAARCRLSLAMHPTDFDDQYSGERLTWLRVNDFAIVQDFAPMISGCNESSQSVLVNFVSEYSLDGLIGENGAIAVAAKIPTVVDECPFEGNLLSGVPIVTCMVRAKPPPVNITLPAPATPLLPPPPTSVAKSADLQCSVRGCIASNIIALNNTEMNFTKCLMNVNLWATDYDQEEGTVEVVEFVNVDNSTIKSNISLVPGLNPCREAWKGKPLSDAEKLVNIVKDQDVTAEAADGILDLSAKISDHVDECAYDGFLLNAQVEVNCSIIAPDTTEAILASASSGSAQLDSSPSLQRSWSRSTAWSRQ